MARGDFLLFNAFTLDLADGVHNLETDTVKLALITNGGTAPQQVDATPRFGAGSGVDYATYEVAEFVGNYVSLGMTVALTTDLAAAVTTVDDDTADLTITQNGAGFDDAYWGILYNDDATNDEAIGFLEMGGPVSQIAGPININWNASGLLTITRT